MANAEKPTTQLELQVAVRKCVAAVPLSLAQKAIDSFYPRCKLCVSQEGKTFKHVLKSKLDMDIPRRPSEAPSPPAILDEPINEFDGVGEPVCDEESEEEQ